jgi:hypothetical protein
MVGAPKREEILQTDSEIVGDEVVDEILEDG